MGLVPSIPNVSNIPYIKGIMTAPNQAKNTIAIQLNTVNEVKKKIDAIKRTQGDMLKILQLSGNSNILSVIPTQASVLSKFSGFSGEITSNMNNIGGLINSKDNDCFKSGMGALKNISRDVMAYVSAMVKKIFSMLKFPAIMDMFYGLMNFIIGIVRKTGIDKVLGYILDLTDNTSCVAPVDSFLVNAKNSATTIIDSIGFTVNWSNPNLPRVYLEEQVLRTKTKNEVKTNYSVFNNTYTDDAFDLVGTMNEETDALVQSTQENVDSMMESVKSLPSIPSIPKNLI